MARLAGDRAGILILPNAKTFFKYSRVVCTRDRQNDYKIQNQHQNAAPSLICLPPGDHMCKYFCRPPFQTQGVPGDVTWNWVFQVTHFTCNGNTT